MSFSTLVPYSPPDWAKSLSIIPKYKLKIVDKETPIHPWNIDSQAAKVWIKRDDFNGTEVSGNKIRKLEFMFADAISKGCDCVITIGGLQSNHCRSTAATAALLGIPCYLCLRTPTLQLPDTLEGNLLLDHLFGAHIILFSPQQRDQLGGNAFVINKVKAQLEKQGKKALCNSPRRQ